MPRLPRSYRGLWHPTAVRNGNRLTDRPGLNGSGMRPIGRIPVQAYTRLVQGIPLTGGQGTAIVSTAAGGGGPALVQAATPVQATSISLPGPTTAGNCVVVVLGIYTAAGAPSVSGVTLGGAAGNFAAGAAANTTGGGDFQGLFIWVDPNCAGGQTAIAVSGSNLTFPLGIGGLMAYEFSGAVTASIVDKTSTDTGGVSTTWTSLATATTTVANEIWVGGCLNGSNPTGPASPWVNVAAPPNGFVSGYQIATATGAATYSGTAGSDTAWAAAVVTLKGMAPSPAVVGGLATITVGPQGLGNVWYPAQATIFTTSGITDTSTCNLYLGPAGVPVTLVATFYPGGQGTAGLAIPSMAPGQYLIAVWTGGNPGDVASLNVIGTMDALMPG
jgi:hypothetical protein